MVCLQVAGTAALNIGVGETPGARFTDKPQLDKARASHAAKGAKVHKLSEQQRRYGSGAPEEESS